MIARNGERPGGLLCSQNAHGDPDEGLVLKNESLIIIHTIGHRREIYRRK
jgi:hypothetical protein